MDHTVSCKGPIAVGDRIILSVTGTAPPIDPPVDPPVDPPEQPPSGDYTQIDMPWATDHKDGVPIPANGTLVVKVVTGTKPSPANNPPNLTVSNWGDGNFPRDACLSYTPNDFSHPLSPLWQGVVGSIQAIFSITTPTMFGYPAVDPNRALYLTIRDKSGLDSQVRVTLATKE